jgi:hypothetical protein
MCIATVAIGKVLQEGDTCRLLFESNIITDWTSRKPTRFLLPIAERNIVQVFMSAQHVECHVLCDVSLQNNTPNR